MIFKPKQELIKVAGVSTETIFKCIFCKASIEINENLTSVKCSSCKKRQLKETVDETTKCEITGKKADDSTIMFTIPNDVLETLTGKIPNDDKENYLLGCTLQVVFATTIIMLLPN